MIVRLTPAGDRAFAAMAARHEDWIADLLAGLSETDIEELMSLLGRSSHQPARPSPATRRNGRDDRTHARGRAFPLTVEGRVATVTLDRPDRKNPLTFESYAELVRFFRQLQYDDAVKVRCRDRRGR